MTNKKCEETTCDIQDEEDNKKVNDNIISNYDASLKYLMSIYSSEKTRFNNFNIRLNWILVFLGVLMVPIKFFWLDSIECNTKSILYFCCLILSIVLLAFDALLCLWTMIPKTKFEETSCDSFIGEKFDNYVNRNKTLFYKSLIEQIAPKAKLYYKENERKSKYIKITYFIACIVIIIDIFLVILKIC